MFIVIGNLGKLTRFSTIVNPKDDIIINDNKFGLDGGNIKVPIIVGFIYVFTKF